MILSLGTVQLGVHYGVNNSKGNLSDAEADELLRVAWESGFSWLDTSSEYGLAEERIGRFIKRYPDSFKVVSKISSSYPKEVRAKILKRSEERMGKIDAVLIYCIDTDIGALNPEEANGISVYTVEEADKIGRFKMIQVPASILDGRMDWEIQFLRGLRKTVLVRSLLLQGLLAMPTTGVLAGHVGNGKFVEAAIPYVAMLRSLAWQYEMDVVEMAVRWVWEVDPNVAVIGCETPEQARDIGTYWKRGPLPKALVERVKTHRKDIPEIVISPRQWEQSYAFTPATVE